MNDNKFAPKWTPLDRDEMQGRDDAQGASASEGHGAPAPASQEKLGHVEIQKALLRQLAMDTATRIILRCTGVNIMHADVCEIAEPIIDAFQQLLSSHATESETEEIPRIYSRCWTCGNSTLTIHDGHLLCT